MTTTCKCEDCGATWGEINMAERFDAWLCLECYLKRCAEERKREHVE